MPELSDLESLINEDGKDFNTIDPAIIRLGEEIATTLMKTGFESWGTFISRGVLFQPGVCKYTSPADFLEGEEEKQVELRVSWQGDREGYLTILIPESGAKGAVGYFLALALGTPPDLENTKLDEEGMDAFSELASTLVQQGAQALRGSPAAGGKIDLKVEKPRIADLAQIPADAAFGTDDMLCQSGQLTIEGISPVTVRVLLSVSCTGKTVALPSLDSRASEDDIAGALKVAAQAQRQRHRNEHIALRLPVPVVVVLATTKMRVENVKELAPGSIIEFRKFAGEFLDVCAGNTKFAEGEVVIVNQHFGIQLRKITPRIPPARSIRNRPGR